MNSDLINKMNRELGEVKGELIGINKKIEDSHDLQFSMHQQNREDIKLILEQVTEGTIQATKTNGRVTSLEDSVVELFAINSKLNGLFTSMIEERENGRKKKEEEKRSFWYKVCEKAIWVVVGALIYYLLGIDAKMFI